MTNRKEKPMEMRLLATFGTFMLIGSLIYLMASGLSVLVGASLVAGILSLGVPAVAAGESFFEVIAGFFEAFFDGIMEVVGGILDAISSMFG